jgi:hypothetical protein
LKASNQFAKLLRGIEERAEQLDFSCSKHFEARLTEKAAFATIPNYVHPLTAYSSKRHMTKRHKMTLTKLALSERNKFATT